MLMNEQAGAAKAVLTVAEVAAMMRVSKMTVYRLVHAGELPAVRVGRSFRVPEAAVMDTWRTPISMRMRSPVGCRLRLTL